jgi:hypothetical protein
MSKTAVRALALALAFMAAGATCAATAPKVTRLAMSQPASYLFVGNSFYYYNNSMHNYFLRIVHAADPSAKRVRGTSATISGSGLNWHTVEAYFGGGMASYSFVGDNEVVFNTFERPFDVVIMNDCSQCPVHPKLTGLFHEYAKKHSDTVRRHGAEPVLFMTWAYQDKPDMTAQLDDQYTKAGNENDALVIPAGLAFAKAIAKRPDLVMYQKDKRHPSPLGTYLSACTIYAAIYGKSPAGIKETGGVDASTAQFLQSVAWETVQEYYGRGR